MQGGCNVIGEETINEAALTSIRGQIRADEQVSLLSGFDFGDKVIAVTNRRVLISDQSDGIVLSAEYGSSANFLRQGRTFVVEDGRAAHKYRMGRDDVVEELLQAVVDFQEADEAMEHLAHALKDPISKLQNAQKAFERRDPITGARWLLEGITSLADVMDVSDRESRESINGDYPFARGRDDAEKTVEYVKGFAQRTLEKLLP